MKLKSYNREPRSGWCFETTTLGMGIPRVIFSESWYELRDDVRVYYKRNKIEIPEDLDKQIEEQLCLKNPPEFSEGGTKRPPYISIAQLKEGTQAVSTVLRERFKGKDIEVDVDEVERRARICKVCPHNVNYHGCWSCVLVDVAIKLMFPKWKTEAPSYVKTCEVCRCVTSAKIHLKKEVLDELPKKEYPDFCWVNHNEGLS